MLSSNKSSNSSKKEPSDSPEFSGDLKSIQKFPHFWVYLTIAVTLINTRVFIYQTLTAYFLFAVSSSVLLFVTGIYIVKSKRNFQLSFNRTSIVIIVWGIYILLNGYISECGFNFKHEYLLGIILLFYTLHLLIHNQFLNFLRVLRFVKILVLVESIICLTQYFGLIPSFNGYFKVTGTQVNPNITAMFLAMGFPLFVFFKSTDLKTPYKLKQILSISLPILLVLIALYTIQCRTAILSVLVISFFALGFHFNWVRKIASMSNKKKSIIIGILVMFGSATLLYYSNIYNNERFEGRALTWKISAGMVKTNPLKGYGYGMFSKEYNLAQAKYFEDGHGTKLEIENASNSSMAFNEILENWIEGGFLGVLIPIALILFVFFGYVKIPEKKLHEIAVGAGIFCFCIMSLINFTIQALPVMVLLIVYLVIISASLPSITKFERTYNLNRFIGFGLIVIGLLIATNRINFTIAHFKLKLAIAYLGQHKPDEAIALFRDIEKPLEKSATYFQYNGYAWQKKGDFEQALFYLQKAAAQTTNASLNMDIGFCFERLGRLPEAEKQYLIAMNQMPKLLLPRYALMKLYSKTNKPKANKMAQSIISSRSDYKNPKASFFREEALKLLKQTENVLIIK